MTTVEKVIGSDVVLFWLDEHIGKPGNCIKLKEEFESNTTNIYLFHDVDQCRQFLPLIKNKKLFCIIQGKLAETIVPEIVEYATEPVVYIFCLNKDHLTEWAKRYKCIPHDGIFIHEKDLLARLTSDLAGYAALKTQEHSFKRSACAEWADNLAKKAEQCRTEQCTLPFKTDPYSDLETSCEQPGE